MIVRAPLPAFTRVISRRPAPNAEVRVLLPYQGTWRAMFWLTVMKDDSLCFGPRYKQIESARKFSAPAGPINVTYGEGGEPVDLSRWKNVTKVSYHASGEVHFGGECIKTDALKSLTEQIELAVLVFEEPDAFEPIPSFRLRDIRVRYPLDATLGLYGLLAAAPKGRERLIQMQASVYPHTILLRYSGLRGAPDLVLQLVLAHGGMVGWSPESYVFLQSEGAGPHGEPPAPQTATLPTTD
jgi:hypothetical protein